MSSQYVYDQFFDKADVDATGLLKGEYEQCSFNGCDFSSGTLADYKFVDCVFIDCNLSLTKLTGTAFRDCTFQGCKLLGLHFDSCNPVGFAVKFESCLLNHASFYALSIKQTNFAKSSLIEVDFSEADLTGSQFDSCDLLGAVFDRTNLEQVDFTTAANFTIDPETNKIRKAKFSSQNLIGLVSKFGIIVSD